MQLENKITSVDLAIHYLYSEQILKQEQIIQIYSYKEKIARTNFKKSCDIVYKALENIQKHLENSNFKYVAGANSQGTFWQFSYKTFEALNANLQPIMNIMYAAHCEEFGKDYVRLYWEAKRQLPHLLLQEYGTWVG